MRLVLAAEESAGMHVLRSLLRSRHELVAVLTTPVGAAERAVSVAKVAARASVPTWPARRIKDPALADELRDLGVDLLLNVHSLHIADAAVVAAPRIGSFNLHPGKLPEYAGLNSASWALYHGAPLMGVTLHRMEPGIDTGDIAYQSTFPIGREDTALSLNVRCIREGLRHIEGLLATASRDPASIPRVPQDLTVRGYYGREVPEAGQLRWDQPAAEIDRFVRACDYAPFRSPWGQPRTQLAGTEIGIVKLRSTGTSCAGTPPGTIGEAVDDAVAVATADEWVLVRAIEADGAFYRANEWLQRGHRLTATSN